MTRTNAPRLYSWDPSPSRTIDICSNLVLFTPITCNINTFILSKAELGEMCGVCVCVWWWWWWWWGGGGGEGMVKRETRTMRAIVPDIILFLVISFTADLFCSLLWISFSMPILEVSALWNSMVLIERLPLIEKQVGGKFLSPTMTGLQWRI